MKFQFVLFLALIGVGCESLMKNEIDKENSHNSMVSNKTSLALADISCDTITAYFNGTFQRYNLPGSQFDAQFQLKIQVGKRDTSNIWIQIQHWNESCLKPIDGLFSFFHASAYTDCHIQDQLSWIPYSKTPTNLSVRLWSHDSDWFYIDVLSMPTNLYTFTLKNALGQCTSDKSTENPYSPNTYLYNYCACCGEYKPDSRIGCPMNPWA